MAIARLSIVRVYPGILLLGVARNERTVCSPGSEILARPLLIKASSATLLRLVGLNLLDEQNPLSICIFALVEADVGKDVGSNGAVVALCEF